ncbi:MAG: CarD family transcriptional regulator [Lysobacterales bacterium]
MFIKCFFPTLPSQLQRREIITISQGDRIHHPNHGIGKVQSIRRRSFSGENGARFAEIFFEREGITLMLRESSLDNTIRAPIGPSRAKNLLEHMKNWKAKVSDQSKTRANTHQSMMDGNDPHAYAEVYKGLRVLEQDEALSTIDRRQLKRCAQFLSEELANALNQTQGKALDLMTQATRI